MSKEAGSEISSGMRSQRIQDPGEPLRDRAERNTDDANCYKDPSLATCRRIEGQEVLGAGGLGELPHNSPSGASTP